MITEDTGLSEFLGMSKVYSDTTSTYRVEFPFFSSKRKTCIVRGCSGSQFEAKEEAYNYVRAVIEGEEDGCRIFLKTLDSCFTHN